MKHLCLIFAFCMAYTIGLSQNSFANISFDGPERYVPKDQRKLKTDTEFRAMKDQIRAFPSRLDYRYNYMYELSNSENWKRLSDEVIALVDFSYDNNHNWIWDNQIDAIGSDAEAFLLNTVQDYVFMLYNTDDESNYALIEQICNAVLADQPDHRDFLTYPAMTAAAVKDYDKALTYLHKAERVHREDGTLAFLMAENYQNLNNTNLALSYFKKALRYGNEREKLLAQREIDKLESTED